MELIDYIRLIRRWLWLLLLAGFIGGSVSFLVNSNQPDLYQAQVKISVGNFINAPNPDSSEIRTGEDLAQTYAVLAKTYNVLEAAVNAKTFPLTPDALGNALSTRVIPDTSLLVLSVSYTDPILAAEMANEVAEQLILNSPSNLTPEQQNQVDLASAEIDRLYTQLHETRLQLDIIDHQLGLAETPEQITQLTTQRNVLIDQINQTSANIAQFSDTVASIQERTNSLDIVERARIPTTPISPSILTTSVLGVITAVALAMGLVLLVEYLNDTIATAEDVTQLLGLPVLGAIKRFGRTDEDYPQRLIAHENPFSPVSEGYRALRTNLLFSADQQTKWSCIVTSPGPFEGKSVTAANLAVVTAKAGLRVLLVDADLRRPTVHKLFGLENELGLTTLLLAEPADDASNGPKEPEWPDDLRACLRETNISNLRVITSGFIPSNPTEILGSTLMQRWFKVFLSSNNVDAVIFDTPPSLVVADGIVLASNIGVPVLMVLQSGHTRRGAAARAKDQFGQVNVDVQGVVLNMIRVDGSRYGYGYDGYQYQYYYYYSQSHPEPRDGWRKLLPRKDKHQEPL